MKKRIPFILLLGLLLSACGMLTPVPGETMELSSPEPGAAEAASAASPVPVMIRDAFCESGSYRDSVGNTWDYVLRIPMIESEGEDAARLSRELNAALEPAVKEAQDSMASGCSLMVTRVDYTVYEKDHLISILCKTDTDWGFESYYAVNYDASTHSEVSRAQLLRRFGLTEDAFQKKAEELVEPLVEASVERQVLHVPLVVGDRAHRVYVVKGVSGYRREEEPRVGRVYVVCGTGQYVEEVVV